MPTIFYYHGFRFFFYSNEGSPRMNTSVKATRLYFDADSLWVDLSDGRTLGVPQAWVPRLLRATPEQREQVRISSRGLHWEALDKDISIAGLLTGLSDGTGVHESSVA